MQLQQPAQYSLLIHLLISGPLRSYRSLFPLQPTECTVVTAFSAVSTHSLPSSSLSASRMIRLLMLAGNVKRRHRADVLSHGGGEVDELCRSGALLQLQCLEWAARLLLCLCNRGSELLASLPLLRRLQSVIRALGARNGRVRRSSSTIDTSDTGIVRSAVAMRSVWLPRANSVLAKRAVDASLAMRTVASATLRQLRTCTPANSIHRSIK